MDDWFLEPLTDEERKMWAEKGSHLPSSEADIEDYLNSMPLVASSQPSEGQKGHEEFEAMKSLQDDATVEDRAETYKESGNKAYKLAKAKKSKAERDDLMRQAFDYYTQAIQVKPLDLYLRSVCYSNRAIVQMDLENYGKAIQDCLMAVRFHQKNIKAYLRAGSAARALGKPDTALAFLARGLKLTERPSERKELEQVKAEIEAAVKAQQAKDQAKALALKKEAMQESARVKLVVKTLKSRRIRLGPSQYLDPAYGGAARYDGKVYVDPTSGALHFPVLFLYPKVLQSDYIQDFSEAHTFRQQLEQMFPPLGAPAPWDDRNEYTLDNLDVYYEVKKDRVVLQDEVDIIAEIERKNKHIDPEYQANVNIPQEEMIRKQERAKHKPADEKDDDTVPILIPLKLTLTDVLQSDGYVIPGIPIFHIAPKPKAAATPAQTPSSSSASPNPAAKDKAAPTQSPEDRPKPSTKPKAKAGKPKR